MKNTDKNPLWRLAIGVLSGLAMAGGMLSQRPDAFQRARQLLTLSPDDEAFQRFGDAFRDDAAGAAYNYERLPVPVSGCEDAGGGCILRATAAKELRGVEPQFLGGLRAVDFFGDRRAFLASVPAYRGDANAKVKVAEAADLSGVRKDRRTAYYAAWTLRDERSDAFPLLARDGKAVLTAVDELASAAPPAAAGRWAFFRAQAPVDPQSLKKSLLIVYNGFSRNQYAVAQVTDAVACAGSDRCAGPAQALNPAFPAADLAPLYALELTLAQSPDELDRFLPKTGAAGGWRAQPDSMMLFPTVAASLDAPGDELLRAPFDVRRFAAWFQRAGRKAQIFAVPAHVSLYKMELAADGKAHDVVRLRFPAARPRETLLRGLPAGARVVFTRQLGTRSFAVKLYDGKIQRDIGRRVQDSLPLADAAGDIALVAPGAAPEPLKLVLGYWSVPHGDDRTDPSEATWFPVGRATVAPGAGPLRDLELVGKAGKKVSAFGAVQAAAAALAGESGYRLPGEGRSGVFDVRFGAMLCRDLEAETPAGAAVPLPLEVAGAFAREVPAAIERALGDGSYPRFRLPFAPALAVDAEQDPIYQLGESLGRLAAGAQVPADLEGRVTALSAALGTAQACVSGQVPGVVPAGKFAWELFPLQQTCRLLDPGGGRTLAALLADPAARNRLAGMLMGAGIMQQAQIAFDADYRARRPKDRCFPATGGFAGKVLGSVLVPLGGDEAQVTADATSRPEPLVVERGRRTRVPDLRGSRFALTLSPPLTH